MLLPVAAGTHDGLHVMCGVSCVLAGYKAAPTGDEEEVPFGDKKGKKK